MLLFVVTGLLALLVNNVDGYGADFDKCCGKDQYMVKNGTYKCTSDGLMGRLQFVNDRADFLSTKNGTKGYCTEVNRKSSKEEEFAVFSSLGEDVNLVETIPDYFPKCCPHFHQYNPITHGCEKTNITYIQAGKFIKIGLPSCDLIVDHRLNSTDDFVLEEDDVHVRKGNNRFMKGTYCLDETTMDDYVLRVCVEDENICTESRCIHKCCPDGQSFIGGKKCRNTYTHGLDLSFNSKIAEPEEPFSILHNFKCSKIYIMSPKRYIFDIDDMGNFHFFSNLTNSLETQSSLRATYCIEHVLLSSKNGFELFKCFEESNMLKFKVTKWVKILSCVFLILTMIVYFLLNEVKKVFGKILVSFCFSILMTFCMLIYSYAAVDNGVSNLSCRIIGYFNLYLIISSFTWLNILCIDIWLTFGTPKSIMERSQRRKDLKRFLFYSLYGWGLPLALTLFVFVFNIYRVLPYAAHPFIGHFKCFLESHRKGNFGSIIFKDIPNLILVVVNIILFFKTIFYCLKVKNEINRMNDTNASVKRKTTKAFNADKERLYLVMRLCLIMGCNFLFEVVSAFTDFSVHPVTTYIEVVWDFINCLQGVFIFIIFICKKKILMQLKKKFNIKMDVRKISRTSTTEISETNTSPVLSRKA
ncbi:G-protein coupled receptor Mth2 isoform X2 [Aethina tumida]|uniref:G-protein coupled receptor Mth2 isoform X2 n=1 Tax=Aethina tumida TaxID=116153 RepID=UPI00096B299B|nr:G-protein coupled receptor Mth2 isoform X2 [Aethina tumida]